jgi:hypothetical protein
LPLTDIAPRSFQKDDRVPLPPGDGTDQTDIRSGPSMLCWAPFCAYAIRGRRLAVTSIALHADVDQPKLVDGRVWIRPATYTRSTKGFSPDGVDVLYVNTSVDILRGPALQSMMYALVPCYS